MAESVAARLYLQVQCPRCPFVLVNDQESGTCQCENPRCDRFEVRYKLPTVTLDAVEDGK